LGEIKIFNHDCPYLGGRKGHQEAAEKANRKKARKTSPKKIEKRVKPRQVGGQAMKSKKVMIGNLESA
jgi:hypothetical protein